MENFRIYQSDISNERLKEHLEAIHENPVLAVDIETTGLNADKYRLCLVQICDQKEQVSLIQFAQGTHVASNLCQLLNNKEIQKIFHFARFDLSFLKKNLLSFVDANPIFCTKIASKLVRTYTDKHGLKTIAKDLLDLDLNKYEQSSYWGKEELSKEQLRYAINDVLYLIKIKESLEKMLKCEEKTQLAQKCFKQIELMTDLDLEGYQNIFEL